MEEQEIDLREYVMVIYKRKWLILGVFLFTAIASSIYSLLLPKTYQTETVIQNGDIAGNTISKSEVLFLLKSSVILKPVIEQYNKNYKEQIEFENFKNWVTVNNFNDNRFTLKVRARSPQKAIEIINQLTDQYFFYMESWFKQQIELFKKKIELNNDSLQKVENSGKELKEEINNFVREKEMQPEPAFKSILLRSLYSQYINELSKYQEKELELSSQLLSIKEFKVLEPPLKSLKPIAPHKKKIVIISGLVSLFAGMLLAFIIEYFQKNRVYLLKNK